MFAVIKTGGKQYTVKEGDIFDVEKLNVEVGQTYSFKDIIVVGKDGKVSTGNPVAGAVVEAEVVEQARAAKVFIFKKKSRKDYRKRQGHRQYYTRVKVTKITL